MPLLPLLVMLAIVAVSVGWEPATRPSLRPFARQRRNENTERLQITRSSTRHHQSKSYTPTSTPDVASVSMQPTTEASNETKDKPVRRGFWTDTKRTRPVKKNLFSSRFRTPSSDIQATTPFTDSRDPTKISENNEEDKAEIRRADVVDANTESMEQPQTNVKKQEDERNAEVIQPIKPKRKTRPRSSFLPKRKYSIGSKPSTNNRSLESNPVTKQPFDFRSKTRNNSTNWFNKKRVVLNRHSTTAVPSTPVSLHAETDDTERRLNATPKFGRFSKKRFRTTLSPSKGMEGINKEMPRRNASEIRRSSTLVSKEIKTEKLSNETMNNRSKINRNSIRSKPATNTARRKDENYDSAKSISNSSTLSSSSEGENISEDLTTEPTSLPEVEPEISRVKRKRTKPNKRSSKRKSKRRRTTTQKPTTQSYENEENEEDYSVESPSRDDHLHTSTTFHSVESTTILPGKSKVEDQNEPPSESTSVENIINDSLIDISRNIQNVTETQLNALMISTAGATTTNKPDSMTEVLFVPTTFEVLRSTTTKTPISPTPGIKANRFKENEDNIQKYPKIHGDLRRIQTLMGATEKTETVKNTLNEQNRRKNQLAKSAFASLEHVSPLNNITILTTPLPQKTNQGSSAAYAIWNFHQGNLSNGWSYENRRGQARWTVHNNDSSYTVVSAEEQATNSPLNSSANVRSTDRKDVEKTNEWLPILNYQLSTKSPSIPNNYRHFEEVQNVQFASKIHELPSSSSQNAKNKRKSKSNRNRQKNRKNKTSLSSNPQTILNKKEILASILIDKEKQIAMKHEYSNSTEKNVHSHQINHNLQHNRTYSSTYLETRGENFIEINQNIENSSSQVPEKYSSKIPHTGENIPVNSGAVLPQEETRPNVPNLNKKNQSFMTTPNTEVNERSSNSLVVPNPLKNSDVKLILNTSDDDAQTMALRQWQVIGDGGENGYALLGENDEIEWNIKFINGKWQVVDAKTSELKNFSSENSQYEAHSKPPAEDGVNNGLELHKNVENTANNNHANENQDFVHLVDVNDALNSSQKMETHYDKLGKLNNQHSHRSKSYNLKDIFPNHDQRNTNHSTNINPEIIFINEADISDILNSDFRLIPEDRFEIINEETDASKDHSKNDASTNNRNQQIAFVDNNGFGQYPTRITPEKILIKPVSYGNTEEDAIGKVRPQIGQSGSVKIWSDGRVQATYPSSLQQQFTPSHIPARHNKDLRSSNKEDVTSRKDTVYPVGIRTGDANRVPARSFRRLNPSITTNINPYHKDFTVNSHMAVKPRDLQKIHNENYGTHYFHRQRPYVIVNEAAIVDNVQIQHPRWKPAEQHRWKISGHNLNIEKQNGPESNRRFLPNESSFPFQRNSRHNAPELSHPNIRQMPYDNFNSAVVRRNPSAHRQLTKITSNRQDPRPFLQDSTEKTTKEDNQQFFQDTIAIPAKNERQRFQQGDIAHPMKNDQSFSQGIISRLVRNQRQQNQRSVNLNFPNNERQQFQQGAMNHPMKNNQPFFQDPTARHLTNQRQQFQQSVNPNLANSERQQFQQGTIANPMKDDNQSSLQNDSSNPVKNQQSAISGSTKSERQQFQQDAMDDPMQNADQPYSQNTIANSTKNRHQHFQPYINSNLANREHQQFQQGSMTNPIKNEEQPFFQNTYANPGNKKSQQFQESAIDSPVTNQRQQFRQDAITGAGKNELQQFQKGAMANPLQNKDEPRLQNAIISSIKNRQQFQRDIIPTLEKTERQQFQPSAIANPTKSEDQAFLQSATTSPIKNKHQQVQQGVSTSPAKNKHQQLQRGTTTGRINSEHQIVLRDAITNPVQNENVGNKINQPNYPNPFVIKVPRRDPEIGGNKQIIVIDFSSKDKAYRTSNKNDFEIVIKNIENSIHSSRG